MARRLVERGVRFVQVYSGGGHFDENWDAHHGMKKNHELHCAETDQPIAALLTDLKERGLLDETLVVWGGEFGRTPTSQGDNKGRDHNPRGFSMWMAGGGIKGGQVYGATDEFGYAAVENKVHVHDLHATILHLMGLDHEAADLLPRRPRNAPDRRRGQRARRSDRVARDDSVLRGGRGGAGRKQALHSLTSSFFPADDGATRMPAHQSLQAR